MNDCLRYSGASLLGIISEFSSNNLYVVWKTENRSHLSKLNKSQTLRILVL